MRPTHTPYGLSRRSLLAGTAGIVAGIGLSACTADDLIGNRTRVRYWNLFGGGDGARMTQMTDAFIESRPDIDFRATTLAWGAPYYTKLAMSAAGGRAPELAILHLSRLGGYAPGRLLDPFPLDMLAELGITQDRFLPDIWNRCTVDGELYAIPLDTHPFVLYYNVDICREIGLLDSNDQLIPLSGTDELIEAFVEARRVTGNLGVSLSTGDVSPWRLWWTLYRQLDGELFDESGTELILDEERGLEALEFMRRLSIEEEVAPRGADYQAAVANFSNGQAAFLFNGGWEVTTFQTQQVPFSMTTFPNVFGNTNRTQGDCHCFVLPHQRNRDWDNTRAALEYVAYMLQNSVDWAAGGHVPSYLPVVESPEYLNLTPQSHYRHAAENVQLDPDVWFSGSASDMESQASGAFGAVHAGTNTPQEALDQFRGALQRLLDTPSPV